ncbi:MAG TPA: phosphate ABC transporter permease subunit PstC [Fimbriiglobus sp.]|nr:phosphate ABC transporter permease subunit PstC [Fimbriiglobus sp.]
MVSAAPKTPATWPEVLFTAATRAAGLFILTLVAGLVVVLVWESLPALKNAGTFHLFTSAEWDPKPASAAAPPTFGSLAFVYGTVVTSIIAMLIAVPLGVASAAFLSEIAPGWLKKTGAFLIELLAAIPSVVYGFWGLFILAPAVAGLFDLVGGPATGGNGILAAGLILSIMILPYITAISFDVCQAVPRSQREGSLALGATRWQTIRNVVLPYARPGIVAACFLALGRALGETMAVTMLIGNQATVSLSPFALGDTIASRIANQFNEADTPEFRAALVALGLVLLLVTAAFNLVARLMLARLTRGPKAGPSAAVAVPGAPDEFEERLPPPPAPTGPARSWAVGWNRVMTGVLGTGFVLTVVPLFLILGYITARGVSALDETLFTHRGRPAMTAGQFEQYKAWQRDEAERPTNEIGRPVKRGGLGHAMLGSLMIVGLATTLAVPLGLMGAIYLAEARRSPTANVVRFVTELLGGVPSIVIGIFAYAVLVYPFWAPGEKWGFSAWAGAFALAVMMIPIVVRSAEESMKLVPDAIRHASYALGANRMQTTLRVVVPASLSAVVTGIFLAVGRIAGETAPLLLTAGNSDFWPGSPAEQTAFLPGYIYNYSRSPYADWQEQAWGGTLVLLTFVMLVNVGIRLLAGKRTVAASRGD